MRHTKGPWHVGMKPGPMIYGLQGEWIADLTNDLGPAEERTANVKLIAAAPEMHSLLVEAAETLKVVGDRQVLPETALPVAERLEALLERLEEK